MEADAEEPPASVPVKNLLEVEATSAVMNHVSAEMPEPAAEAALSQEQLQKMVAEGYALMTCHLRLD